jgi:hypothetical protein
VYLDSYQIGNKLSNKILTYNLTINEVIIIEKYSVELLLVEDKTNFIP